MSRTSRKKSQPRQNIFPDAHNILMNAPIGVFTSTPDGRYISAYRVKQILDYDSAYLFGPYAAGHQDQNSVDN